jgi:NADPH:quinone reductase-like Zn-dependent oxidoreductase
MKTVVCPKYGPPEVLALKDGAMPICQDNEILVNIKATTVVQADVRCRGFRVPLSFWIPARLALGVIRPKRPVLGTELSGVVEEVGRNVKRFKPGDDVFALTGHDGGCYAEFRCVHEGGIIALKPKGLSFEEAAVMPMGGLTALYFLRKGNLRSGQKVLVYGASGSIGTYAVQLAKNLGAEVTGVCSTANLEMVKSLGADKVIDYTKEDLAKQGVIYDVILDAVGKSPYSSCVKSLKNGGAYLTVVGAPALSLRMKWSSMITGKRLGGGVMSARSEDLDFLKELVEAGKLRPVIDRSYPMEDIVEAHRYVDKGHKRGNVAITVEHVGEDHRPKRG